MERYLHFGGQTLYTESLGSPIDPAILLISGAGAHAHFWTDSFCEKLVEAGYFVIRYDHRDVGLSSPSSEKYDLGRLAKDAVELLDGYEIDAAHIVGHSMGGYIAQLLGADFPSRVLSLSLISAGPIGEPAKGFPPPAAAERKILQETWRVMLRNRPTMRFDESLEGFMDVWRRMNGAYPVDIERASRYTEELYTRSNYPVGVHQRHVEAMEQIASTLKERGSLFAQIHAPTLIIQGVEDYLVTPMRGGQLLASALPQATLQLIPQMGHMLFHEEAENSVAETILHFLQQMQ